MRNAFQTLIDSAKGDKRLLVAISIQIAETQRSIYDAILKAPEGSERRAALELVHRDTKLALNDISRTLGWPESEIIR